MNRSRITTTLESEMLTVGVDLIDIKRIEEAVTRHGERFLERVYTEAERDHCAGRIEALAVRWAAKEAVAKALGTGVGDVRWREIEVWCDERGKPYIRLHGSASQLAARLGISDLAVSLAHEGNHAIAFVVGTGTGKPGSRSEEEQRSGGAEEQGSRGDGKTR